MNPMQKTLERFLAPEQIRYLVWALKKEKSIYFYGEQGTGKSYLQHLLHDFGGLDVHEPGEEDFKAHRLALFDNPFEVPPRPEGIVLIELYGDKEKDGERIPVTKEDVGAWVKASGL